MHTRKVKQSIKYTDTAARSLTCHTATGTHMLYRITQCYLPPGKADIPTLVGGVAQRLAAFIARTKLTDVGPVGTWTSDRLWVGIPSRM